MTLLLQTSRKSKIDFPSSNVSFCSEFGTRRTGFPVAAGYSCPPCAPKHEGRVATTTRRVPRGTKGPGRYSSLTVKGWWCEGEGERMDEAIKAAKEHVFSFMFQLTEGADQRPTSRSLPE